MTIAAAAIVISNMMRFSILSIAVVLRNKNRGTAQTRPVPLCLLQQLLPA
jgi:hypothetical protein